MKAEKICCQQNHTNMLKEVLQAKGNDWIYRQELTLEILNMGIYVKD